MTACALRFSAAFVALSTFLAGARADDNLVRPTREAEATLVVFNTRDPESRGLAEYYAERRRIPPDQVIGLDCPLEEEITRRQFTETIEKPLRSLLERKGWWSVRKVPGGKPEVTGGSIRFIALMRGIPLKIATTIPAPVPDATPPPRPYGGDPVRSHDEAAVDSELAVLGAFENEHFGILPNPYFRRFSPILDSSIPHGLLLVARLDAPTADAVRRMIDDTLLAERAGLHGWAYIDRRSIAESPYREGDEWLRQAAAECWNHGIPVNLDNTPTIFPAGFPVTDAALYYGWYAWTVGGAMSAPQFVPGAVAVHIHSFSAGTLRDPNANWAAPLITRGAAATLGNVYEPYLDLTPHLDVFNERLLQGFTLAESAYMSFKVLSWMTTVIGDPLYRPFAEAQSSGWLREPDPTTAPWLSLGKQLRRGARSGPMQALYLEGLAKENPTGLNYEALAMLQSFHNEPRAALKSLELAGTLYKDPAQSFRTLVERLRIMQALADKTAALKLIDRSLRRIQPPDRAKLLTDIRNEIAPPPPTPSPTPKKP